MKADPRTGPGVKNESGHAKLSNYQPKKTSNWPEASRNLPHYYPSSKRFVGTSLTEIKSRPIAVFISRFC